LIEIYTDGAYNPILNQGGWAAVIVENEQKRAVSGVIQETTSNRMEITAILEGILAIPKGSEMSIHTDSQYVYGTMVKNWKRRVNNDLWEKLDKAASERKIKWNWIERNDNPFHKEAHSMATGLASNNDKSEKKEKETPQSEGEEKLTHIDEQGKPRMVDISEKSDSKREAIAGGLVRMKPSTFQQLREGSISKGNVLEVAQLAGIMAAKQTPHLIPLCHPILIGEVKVEFTLNDADSTIGIKASAKSTGKTGVEMEALTAVAVAALTIYDMCKAVDKGMKIENIRLIKKSGGKSGTIILEKD